MKLAKEAGIDLGMVNMYASEEEDETDQWFRKRRRRSRR